MRLLLENEFADKFDDMFLAALGVSRTRLSDVTVAAFLLFLFP